MRRERERERAAKEEIGRKQRPRRARKEIKIIMLVWSPSSAFAISSAVGVQQTKKCTKNLIDQSTDEVKLWF